MKPSVEEMKELQAAAKRDIEAGKNPEQLILKMTDAGVDYAIATQLVQHAQFLVRREQAPPEVDAPTPHALRGLLIGPLLFLLGAGVGTGSVSYYLTHGKNGFYVISPKLAMLGVLISLGCFLIVLKKVIRKIVHTLTTYLRNSGKK